MSAEKLQDFLDAAGKHGQFTFGEYHSALPYPINSPMYNTCVAFIRDYNRLASDVRSGEITPRAGGALVAKQYEATFGDARVEKYAEFTKEFFGNTLVDSSHKKQLMKQLNNTYRGSDMPLDTSLLADLLITGSAQLVVYPYKKYVEYKKFVAHRNNIQTLTAVEDSARNFAANGNNIYQAADTIRRDVVINAGAPSPEALSALDKQLDLIKDHPATMHRAMDAAYEKNILGAMKPEVATQIIESNKKLQQARLALGHAISVMPEDQRAPLQKKLDALDEFMTQGETLKAEVRTQAALIDLQSKNVEDILRLRIESGESLSKSDIAVLEGAQRDLSARMQDVERILVDNGHVAHQNDLKSLETFKERMSGLNALLDNKNMPKNLMPDELKAKMRNLLDPKLLESIQKALAPLMRIFGAQA